MRPFYLPLGDDRYEAQASSAGPWRHDSQHGGPPAALLTRAVERWGGDAGRTIGRLVVDLLGPVPLGVLKVTASVVRPGRSVELCEATLYDEGGDREVATARAWLFPAAQDGPGRLTPPQHTFADGDRHERPRTWHGGYLDAMDWRWVSGAVEQPGPGVVWMRPTVALVDGEWLCLDAQTTLGRGRVGMATSQVYDTHGLVARSAQALLVSRR